MSIWQMNASDSENVEFLPGMRVRGQDGTIGEIICRGREGEWVVREADGNVVVCLEKDLRRVLPGE